MTTDPLRQLKIDACHLVNYLEVSRQLSNEVKQTCIQALNVYLLSSTPEECVAEFRRAMADVERIILLELGV